ncbi:MAG TPA: prolyl oligopeptidase family serine peptidase [Candidatus Sphingobacterium stercoripullorum]|nr:prolyl oligopeptidase family serine peptidase [Candidatus Sphingobacterium stercoripullorum]
MRILKNVSLIFFILSISLGGVFTACDNKTKPRQGESLIPVADFFESPDRTNLSLSPDGRFLAYLGFDNHCTNIFLLDLIEPDSSKQLTYQEDLDVQYFFWVDSARIAFSNSQSFKDSVRMMLVDVQSEEIEPMFPAVPGKVRWVHIPGSGRPDYLLAAMNDRDSSLFDLYRIDLENKTRELLDKNKGNISRWFASSDGQVRLALTSDSLEESLLYRPRNHLPFAEVLKIGLGTSVYPMGLVKDSLDVFYALSNVDRDKLALVKWDAKTGEEIELLLESDQVDINSGGYSTLHEDMLYTSSTLVKDSLTFYNDTLADNYKKIQGHFPGMMIHILDVDRSLDKLLFHVFSDVKPGGFYLYDAQVDSASLIVKSNPKLEGVDLHPTEAVTFRSRDDLPIQGYVTYPKGNKKNNPTVVLVHDGPGRRDYWGFNSQVQFLASRGYAVFQVNYRGSKGFGKDFWAAGFKEWGGKVQTDITDGVAWLIHQDIADKDRIAIMGSGFGGYSALYAATFNSSMFQCAISNSGYSNLFTFFKEIPPHLQPYLQLYYEMVGNPHKESDMFRATSPVFHADKVSIPVMLVQGGKERVSSVTDVHQFVRALKNNHIPVKYMYLEDDTRRLEKEENKISYYLEVEKFLYQYLH